MSQSFNYRHLFYFWVVAKEGGIARAAERLDMAVQTISAQVRDLEKSLGHQLLKPSGRGVALTEAGQAAYGRAEEIFQLGQCIVDEVREAASAQVARLSVGLSDGISKLAAHALLEPVLATPHLRLVCHEGEFDELLSELALHQLDVVLAGQAAPPALATAPEQTAFRFFRWGEHGGLETQALSHAFLLQEGGERVRAHGLSADERALAARAFATAEQARHLFAPWLLAGFSLNFPENLATRDQDRRELGPTLVAGTRETYGRLADDVARRLPPPETPVL